MKISEYIAKMQALMQEHGDLLCVSHGDLGIEIADAPYLHTLEAWDVVDDCGPEYPLDKHALGTSVLVIG